MVQLGMIYYCYTIALLGPINHQQHPTTTFIRDYEPSITIWQVAIVWVGWFNPLVFSGTFFRKAVCFDSKRVGFPFPLILSRSLQHAATLNRHL